MDRLSPLDASFLHIEDDISHMHIASVAIFEGPPPRASEVEAMIASKLPLVPRYRQKVRFVPLDLGRPVWVDDPHFNLAYHVRHTAIPAPGGDAQLRNLTGRVMSQKLDRSKPLWECWVAEGLEGDRWAMLSKVHHCMVDGIAGTDLLTVILEPAPEPAPAPPDDWSPAPEPADATLVRDALTQRVLSPYELVRAARSVTRVPRESLRRVAEAGRGLAALTPLVRPTPPSSLNGPIGPHRRWDWARTTLDDIKRVRSALGGTVNDVVLCAITRGFRDLLSSRGEPVAGRVVRTMVPVSVRTPDERGDYNNKVSAMVAELPIGISDAAERLQAIRSQLDHLKHSKQAVAGEVLTSLGGFAPPMLLTLGTRVGARLASRLGQRSVNTVTTNVPGPQFALYAAGRRMLEVFPYVPLGGAIRIAVAIFSYDGKVAFGVTGDYDTAEDLGVLCAGIEDGMTELLKASR